MTIEEILDELELLQQPFPRFAVKQAIKRAEETTPHLLRILEDTAADPETVAQHSEYMAHEFAMLLLAQFRETIAYEPLLRIAALPGDLTERLIGERQTEHLGRCLASVWGGGVGGIKRLIENEEADEFSRDAGFTALVTLVNEGEFAREDAVSYLRSLFHGGLKREENYVWTGLVDAATDLYPDELYNDILRAYKDGLVDPMSISIDDVVEARQLGLNRSIARLRQDPHARLITDVVKEMEWWYCFSPEFAQRQARLEEQETNEDAAADPADGWSVSFVPAPIRRSGPKISRNDPCPCGSGRKYKRCCGG